MAVTHQPQAYPGDSSNYESSSVQLEDFTHSEYEVPLGVVTHHAMQVQQPTRSVLESSEMSVGDDSSQVNHMMDDI